MAFGGQSFMQCGWSQCRQECGTCNWANEAPALRSSLEMPPWVSAQAFSQLSQPTQSASWITSALVASPKPCAMRKLTAAPASGRTSMPALPTTRPLTTSCRGSMLASARCMSARNSGRRTSIRSQATGAGALAPCPAGKQAHLAKEIAASQGCGHHRRPGRLQRHVAIDDRQERRAIFTGLIERFSFTEHARHARPMHSALAGVQRSLDPGAGLAIFGTVWKSGDDVAFDHQLAKRQRVQLAKHGHHRFESLEQLLAFALKRQSTELRLEQRIVGGADVVAVDVLDHVVALIHGLLDERIAGQ